VKLDDAQRSILAVGGLLNEINGDDHALLGGSARPAASGRVMTILGSGWDVLTPRDAVASLTWLADGGHRIAYAEREGCSPEAFHGWDFGRMANVAGWAYVACLIDRETAWAWMRRAAHGVKAAFGSFAELGRSYLRGQAVWAGGGGDRVLGTQRALAELVSREGSPFLLPFLPSIEDVPPPDPEVREVEVAEGGSIAAAVEQAGPNGRVVLGAGVFRESVRPKHSIEIVGAGRDRTALESAGTPPVFVDPRIGVVVRDLATPRPRYDPPSRTSHGVP
jgi:Protein of unknown function (DUF1266)